MFRRVPTQGSAWAGFDLSGMSPLGGGGTTPGIFQVHGVDSTGHVVIRRQLKRRAVLAFFQKLLPCLVGIEACASSHHWSRELQALGHTVRLMPPAYVKPFSNRPVGVKRFQNYPPMQCRCEQQAQDLHRTLFVHRPARDIPPLGGTQVFSYRI
jgi:transposase